MMRILAFTLILALVAIQASAGDWRQFRGSEFGVTSGRPPTEWNVPEQKNVAWQADLPGRGPASPIVVGDRVVVTASSGVKQDQLHVLCFDLKTGRGLWQRNFWATGRTACHPQSAVAAPTPASDGQRIFAYFSSNDLICLDLDGNLQWYRGLTYDYPHSGNDVGMSSSPVVVDGIAVVQCENQGDSFAIGVEAATGETRWRIDREASPSWTSPVALPANQQHRSLVLLQSSTGVTAHDPATGEEQWRFDVSSDVIPSPVLHYGRAYFVSAGGLYALDVGSENQPKESWTNNRLKPGAASPIIAGNNVYTINRAGVLHCGDASSGASKWELRLKGEFWATPAVVGDLMFLLSQDGLGQVVRLGDEKGQIIAENPVGETLQASPAVAGDSLIVRSDQHLWCFRAAQ
jgi:outer membrane protein assembly factor BamB